MPIPIRRPITLEEIAHQLKKAFADGGAPHFPRNRAGEKFVDERDPSQPDRQYAWNLAVSTGAQIAKTRDPSSFPKRPSGEQTLIALEILDEVTALPAFGATELEAYQQLRTEVAQRASATLGGSAGGMGPV